MPQPLCPVPDVSSSRLALGAGYLLVAWGNAYVDASLLGIYSVVQPVVTVLVASIVIALSAPPHWDLKGLSISDLGAIGVVLGLVMVVYDNRVNARNQAMRGDLGSEVDSTIDEEKLLATHVGQGEEGTAESPRDGSTEGASRLGQDSEVNHEAEAAPSECRA